MLNQSETLREKELVKIRENYQVTIPYGIRRLIRLAVGDYVEINLKGNCLMIKPVKIVAKKYSKNN